MVGVVVAAVVVVVVVVIVVAGADVVVAAANCLAEELEDLSDSDEPARVPVSLFTWRLALLLEGRHLVALLAEVSAPLDVAILVSLAPSVADESGSSLTWAWLAEDSIVVK